MQPSLSKIKEFFPDHHPQVAKTFTLLAYSIVRSRTVCLSKCVSDISSQQKPGTAKDSSIYTRLIRFFKMSETGADKFCIGVLLLILSLVGPIAQMTLVVDRSNWRIGKQNVNVLFIGLLLPCGVYIPLIWQPLSKKGNSKQEEREKLLQRLFKAWPEGAKLKGGVLLADREFIGIEWFKVLNGKEINFVIRARNGDYRSALCEHNKWKESKLSGIINRKIKRNGFFTAEIILGGQLYYYHVMLNEGKRAEKGDHWLILITPEKDVAKASELYRKRWSIEVFFRHAKTNGFNLEDLNLSTLPKIQLMVACVAVAYTIAINEGLSIEQSKPAKTKKFRNGMVTRAVSIFRVGYDKIRAKILQIFDLLDLIRKILDDNKLTINNLHKSV
jgi:hypothetical protein